MKSYRYNSGYFLMYFPKCILHHFLYILTRGAEPRTRSELRHIDNFYGENLPGMTVNAFPNDAEWSSATMRTKCQIIIIMLARVYTHSQMINKLNRKLIKASD